MTFHSVLQSSSLYLGDNGQCFCGNHAGFSAMTTGRDVSGQRVMLITPDDQQYAFETFGSEMVCETCAS